MRELQDHREESILVCVYYGPNGERLIRRGHRLASLLKCPMYVLTVDSLPIDEFDAEKSGYIDRWKELSEELNVTKFIIRDNEKRPTAKVIAEVAEQYNITQVVIGQTPQNRWEEITRGSFVNVLLRELKYVDLHVIAIDPALNELEDATFERGVKAFLVPDGDGYKLSFARPKECPLEGIFYKEIGTDFNNGVFKFVLNGKTYQVHVADNKVTQPLPVPIPSQQK